jgi:molybdenum cofactor biosynthesis enzyme MoaA
MGCPKQALTVGSFQWRFAIVANTPSAAGVIQAVVSVVSDQNYSRARTDVAIIRNIQEQFTARLILNPLVEDRDQRRRVNLLGILYEKLYVDVLKLHGGRFFSSVRPMKKPFCRTCRRVYPGKDQRFQRTMAG